MSSIYYSKEQIDSFRNWLKLDLNGLTWQGNFKEEFEEFWELLFYEGDDLENLVNKFNFLNKKSDLGPLNSWFSWLRDKLIIYSYINFPISIKELSKLSGLGFREVSIKLRNFFINKVPGNEDFFDEVFLIGNIASTNLNKKFSDFDDLVDKKLIENGRIPTDFLEGLEVTLYDDWKKILLVLKNELSGPSLKIGKIKAVSFFKSGTLFLGEIVSIVIVGVVLIFLVKEGNKIYENYLVEKIEIFGPNFLWLDKNLKFKKEPKVTNFNELRQFDLDSIENRDELDQIDDSKFEFNPESEVQLTSWDSLPKDFNRAQLETSGYEELKKWGNRHSRFGRNTLYRIMMTSNDTRELHGKMEILNKKYGVTQVDVVEPGKLVPGGIYYNIYVPTKYLPEFMTQVNGLGDAMLYETRTRRRNPPGRSKVFLWVKSL